MTICVSAWPVPPLPANNHDLSLHDEAPFPPSLRNPADHYDVSVLDNHSERFPGNYEHNLRIELEPVHSDRNVHNVCSQGRHELEVHPQTGWGLRQHPLGNRSPYVYDAHSPGKHKSSGNSACEYPIDPIPVSRSTDDWNPHRRADHAYFVPRPAPSDRIIYVVRQEPDTTMDLVV